MLNYITGVLLKKIEEYSTLILSFLINVVFYPQKRLNLAKIRRIVVIKLDHIGDVVLSMPALASLRANFPKAHIGMVVNPSSESLARLIPYIDEVMRYNSRFFDRSGKSRMLDIPKGIRFARDMRMGNFDLIIDLRGSFASLLYALMGNARYRLDRGTYLIYRKLDGPGHDSIHEARVNLDIIERAGIRAESKKLWLNLTDEDIKSADMLLRGWQNAGFIVAMHPGGPSQLKRWSAEKYIQLGNKLQREYNAGIIILGGRGEEYIAENIVKSIGGQTLNLVGKTTLNQLASVLQKVQLFIGNDSGPMHIASACGIRVIGLFGPTSPQRFGPYGDYCIALRMEKNCKPCMADKCKKPNYKCIDQISVEDVMNAVSQISHDLR